MSNYSTFIPENLRDTELFQLVVSLLDYIDENETTGDVLQYDDLLFDVFYKYDDSEAVLAYYNTAIRPFIGTNTAMATILNLLSIDGVVKEWYDTDDSPYKFSILLNSIPSFVNIDKLIDLVFLLKNERSHLTSLGLGGCMGVFKWDEDDWSSAVYDDTFGVKYRDVAICFYEIRDFDGTDSVTSNDFEVDDRMFTTSDHQYDDDLIYDESPEAEPTMNIIYYEGFYGEETVICDDHFVTENIVTPDIYIVGDGIDYLVLDEDKYSNAAYSGYIGINEDGVLNLGGTTEITGIYVLPADSYIEVDDTTFAMTDYRYDEEQVYNESTYDTIYDEVIYDMGSFGFPRRFIGPWAGRFDESPCQVNAEVYIEEEVVE